jgi:hypothetical protein
MLEPETTWISELSSDVIPIIFSFSSDSFMIKKVSLLNKYWFNEHQKNVTSLPIRMRSKRSKKTKSQLIPFLQRYENITSMTIGAWRIDFTRYELSDLIACLKQNDINKFCTILGIEWTDAYQHLGLLRHVSFSKLQFIIICVCFLFFSFLFLLFFDISRPSSHSLEA